MKAFITSIFVLLLAVSFGQEKPCNQLPVKADVKANFYASLSDNIAENLPERLDVKEAETATFKVQVACDGTVKYCIIESGNMGQDYQEVVIAQSSKELWVPATKEGKKVTTNLYFECTIDKGKVTLSVL